MGCQLMSSYLSCKRFQKLKSKLEGVIKSIYEEGSKAEFLVQHQKVPAATVITNPKARKFWESYEKEVRSWANFHYLLQSKLPCIS
jgi:hypothetical protein